MGGKLAAPTGYIFTADGVTREITACFVLMRIKKESAKEILGPILQKKITDL